MLVATPLKREGSLWVPTTRAEREEQERLSRYATLTCGMYAWQHDQPGKCEEAGSGILVAPGLVLTAKHVVNSMGGLDPRWRRDEHEHADFDAPQFDIRLYQAPRFEQPVLWYAKGSIVRARDTDIAILTIVPESDTAKWAVRSGALAQAFVPWRLEPPPIGGEVELYGWPKPEITNDGTIHGGPVKWVQQHGVVTDVFPVMRTHGYVDFPSFRIERPVEGAFSGGPVFYKGALVGITSVSTEIDPDQPDVIGDTYIASLWPLLLRSFEYRGAEVSFGDLFDAGVIRAVDYPLFRGCVTRVACDRCQFDDAEHPGHAEWRPA